MERPRGGVRLRASSGPFLGSNRELEIEKNYKEDVKWPEYEEIFTGGVPKRKPYQDPLGQPAPIVVRRLYWRSLPLEKILFASIVTTRREPNRPYSVYHRGIIANLCYILMARSD
jgi:hypothetical protein